MLAVIVALEQNMLENTLIQTDLEKVMAVIVSIIKQVNVFEFKRDAFITENKCVWL